MKTLNGNKTGQCQSVLYAILVFGLASTVVLADGHLRTYRVTVQNLTEGQALTPPIMATHAYGTHIFNVGEPASAELQAVAENGNSMLLHDWLMAQAGVLEIAEGATGPLVPAANPGNTEFIDVTDVMITGDPAARYLSLASMLICTNDGFTGLNGVSLPRSGARVILTAGYDAGTEVNTEDFADLVPPCQGLIGVSSSDAGTGESNPMLAENGVIAHHPGIQGGDDLLPEIHDWKNPVAKITITCIDQNADRFVARLSGAAQVPVVPTFATGWATFSLNDQRKDLDYELHVQGISGATQAHIHYGLPGKNGGVAAFLFGLVPATGLVNGELSRGTITEADLIGDFAGDFEGFAQALRDGQFYVNVHTADHAPGEIRGQIGARHSGPGRRHRGGR